MKANELMLNDLVLYRGRIHKVEDIALNDYIYLYSDYCYEEPEITDVSPIPLTAEILEKNGFRYEHNYGQYYRSILGDYARDKEPTISIGWNSKGEMCEWDIADGKRGASYGRHLLGVHELQHALRLCGLTELADNFKIE